MLDLMLEYIVFNPTNDKRNTIGSFLNDNLTIAMLLTAAQNHQKYGTVLQIQM